MRSCLIAALLLGWVSSAAAAPPGRAGGRKGAGPVEIEFATMVVGTGIPECKLHVVIRTENATKFRETYNIGAGTEAAGVRDLVKASIPEGWKIRAVGDTILVIEGYKGSPVKTAEIKAEGLPKGYEPTVRHLPKKKGE